MVSGGVEPAAVLGENREETLPGSPADQPGAAHRSDRRTAAQGGLQRPAALRQDPGGKALRGKL